MARNKKSLIHVNLDAKNIGPHDELHFSDNTYALKVGMYAGNGVGKTFISRMFQLAEDASLLVPETTAKLLAMDQEQGIFSFNVTNANEPAQLEQTLKISLKAGKAPFVTNTTGYLFHVFNSDYVAKNLENCGYAPSGDMTGYVVGQANIDVSKDEKKLAAIKADEDELNGKLEESVHTARKELEHIGVRANTTELGKIEVEYIISGKPSGEEEKYDILLEQLRKLKTLPDGLEDIVFPEFAMDYSFLEKTLNILKTSYTRAEFSERFLETVRMHGEFIKDGVEQIKRSGEPICPFCKQPLETAAQVLIKQYDEYLQNEESKVISEVGALTKACQTAAHAFATQLERIRALESSFNMRKGYFAKFADTVFPQLPDGALFKQSIDELCDLLEKKVTNISVEIIANETIKKQLSTLDTKYKDISREIETMIKNLNGAVHAFESEKLTLRKRLCNAKYEKLLLEQRETTSKLIGMRNEYTTMRKSLEEKREGMKTSRHSLVAKTFCDLLFEFFGEKYKLDEKDFSLIFRERSLNESAANVLSDGEKNIVAFCYYLATTHTLAAKETDYDRILFVVDDPISSMDFHYVYAMEQVIRGIRGWFPTMRGTQLIVLTHNAEFMNILCRNNVISLKLLLSHHTITKLKGDIIAPYHAHLQDINKIVTGAEAPTHTTGNSIRHVLETLWHFERPDLPNFSSYFDTLEELRGNEYLYSLSNEMSHGGFRQDVTLDNDLIQRGCSAVIALIQAHYSGQITALNGDNSP